MELIIAFLAIVGAFTIFGMIVGHFEKQKKERLSQENKRIQEFDRQEGEKRAATRHLYVLLGDKTIEDCSEILSEMCRAFNSNVSIVYEYETKTVLQRELKRARLINQFSALKGEFFKDGLLPQNYQFHSFLNIFESKKELFDYLNKDKAEQVEILKDEILKLEKKKVSHNLRYSLSTMPSYLLHT